VLGDELLDLQLSHHLLLLQVGHLLVHHAPADMGQVFRRYSIVKPGFATSECCRATLKESTQTKLINLQVGEKKTALTMSS
jgi:hypothetical protein